MFKVAKRVYGPSIFELGRVNMIMLLLNSWTCLWMYYNFHIRTMFPNPLTDDPMSVYRIDLPDSCKCIVKQVSTNPINNFCETEGLDGWTVGHLLIYSSIGAFVPGHYGSIFFVSVVCEMWEYYFGWRARWFVDPITNMIGYIVGSGLLYGRLGVNYLMMYRQLNRWWLLVANCVVIVSLLNNNTAELN